ncbi:hypothetical protein GPECTOR_37g215 [Gonium pectorale]|uniref:Aminoglycoside phosphotransferase domain-containing protein n=1 Tax=Gonium pectorale TaxID=33097 RepID=A0A150GBK5_GONPE|nr:hypothetical protein GPECTOR_37g215 [Gonium pectorale]|eukprot:KXZ47209.1 hypothetical protein GPECTOR_37g215 [Gonium pectorale]
MKRQRTLPAPSKLSPLKEQSVPAAAGGPLVHNWRQAAPSSIPAALQHPAFGMFLDWVKKGACSQEDMEAAAQLCAVAAPYYSYEAELQSRVVPLLCEYLGVSRRQDSLTPFSLRDGECSVKPDWHVVDDRDGVTCLLVLMQANNGLNPAVTPLLGPHLRVSSLAWLGRITVCPLTPLLNILWLEDDPQVRNLACTLRALKDTLAQLRTFYSSIPVAPPQIRNPGILQGLPYPLLEQYGNACLLSCGGRMVYEAVRPADNVRVVVKFARFYGVAAHVAWANLGLAPKLFRKEQLPGGICMFEMELLDEAEGWQSLFALAGTPDARSAEAAALQQLKTAHASSQPAFVHGDMRKANCVVRPARASSGSSGSGGWEVRFLDFEFAGVEGVDRYPSPLNPSVPWAPGAEYGLPLDRSHDIHLLQQDGR